MTLRLIPVFALLLIGCCLTAQESKIDQLRLQLNSGSDSLVVKYNLTGKRNAFGIRLDVMDGEGRMIFPMSVSGDMGRVNPGNDKTIFWDMKRDQIDFSGKTLYVKVVGNIFIPYKAKREIWIPWLYIASAACAGVSVYAHIRADQLYKAYSPSEQTQQAEDIHSDVVNMQNLRNVMAGASGILGAAGVVVHIRHIQKKKMVTLSYKPLREGSELGLTYQF